MKFYFSYFKLRFITGLQYRIAAVSGVFTQLFFGFIFIMVYLAFYESNNSSYPMEVYELVSYLWLNQVFFSLTYLLYKDNEIYEMIRNGNISYELTRPKNLYFMWYSKIIGQRVAMVSLRAIPVLIIAFLIPKPYGLSIPYSPFNLLLFIISLFIGAFLMTSIVMIFHILTLITLNEKGITNVCAVLGDILSGGVIPIPFFPPVLKFIANILPFRYIGDLPYRIYSNNISISNGVQGIIIQVIWIIITIILGNVLLKKSLKRVVVQGG